MIALRKRQKAFHPNASQNVQFVDDRLFAVVRTWDQAESIFVLINVSDANVPVRWDVRKLGWSGISRLTDIVSGRSCEILDDHLDLTVAPYQVLWLKPEKRS